MDWDLPTWEPERLRAHADALAEQAAETAAHKEKQKLLGKARHARATRQRHPSHLTSQALPPPPPPTPPPPHVPSHLAPSRRSLPSLPQVEAALWLRKLDPPIALHMMTTPQLRKLLAKLNGSPTSTDNASPTDAATLAASAPGVAAKASPKDAPAKTPAS